MIIVAVSTNNYKEKLSAKLSIISWTKAYPDTNWIFLDNKEIDQLKSVFPELAELDCFSYDTMWDTLRYEYYRIYASFYYKIPIIAIELDVYVEDAEKTRQYFLDRTDHIDFSRQYAVYVHPDWETAIRKRVKTQIQEKTIFDISLLFKKEIKPMNLPFFHFADANLPVIVSDYPINTNELCRKKLSNLVVTLFNKDYELIKIYTTKPSRKKLMVCQWFISKNLYNYILPFLRNRIVEYRFKQ